MSKRVSVRCVLGLRYRRRKFRERRRGVPNVTRDVWRVMNYELNDMN